MKLKNKIRALLLALFATVTLLLVAGSYYLDYVAKNSISMLRDNYKSMRYTHEMSLAMNDIIQTLSVQTLTPSQRRVELRKGIDQFESFLNLQTANADQGPEDDLTQAVRNEFTAFSQTISAYTTDDATVSSDVYMQSLNIRNLLEQVYEANETTIRARTEEANGIADRVTLYLIIFGFIFTVFAIGALLYIPNLLADPINTLTEGIRQITSRNYEKRIPVTTKDELGELARSFNIMAVKMEEYDNSNFEQILLEKRRTETVIQGMNDAIIGMDADKKVLFVNERFLELTGCGEDDLVGYHAIDIADNNELFKKLLKEVLYRRIRKNRTYQSVAIDNAGKRYYYNKEILVVDEAGNPSENGTTEPLSGFVIVLKNITRLKEKDVAKTNFLATLSHELKTPISAIDMSLGLLKDDRIGALNEEQTDLVKTVEGNTRRLLNMVNDILDVSKIETGNLKLDFQQVTAGEIVERAVDNVQSLYREKGVHIEQTIENDLPTLLIDLQKTSGVLINFLANALRYTSSGTTVDVDVCRESEVVRFFVTDRGRGIGEEDLKNVFKKYARARNDRTKGTGLGLAISKEFIEAQGGKIWVKSKPGKGSRFGFDLPVR